MPRLPDGKFCSLAIVQKLEGPNTYDLKIWLSPSGNFDYRSPESRHDGVIYMGLDGERDLLETFHTSHQVIQSVIDMVSKH